MENREEIMEFTPAEIIQMQEIVMQRIGGGAGVLNMGILESSAHAPFESFSGQDLYPTVFDKAARYATAFDKKQVFIDGNKRVSVSVMLGWLAKNGLRCTLSNFALHEMMMDIANNAIRDEDDLAQILKDHVEPTKIFEGMRLEAIMNELLDTYEQTYMMLGAGAGDPRIDAWKQEMRQSGDDGNYRRS